MVLIVTLGAISLRETIDIPRQKRAVRRWTQVQHFKDKLVHEM